ncbi:MAG: hypothetical protein ACJA0V_004709 [Planctomycetota bacterium]|jgi:hypothetical protein
MFFLPPHSHRVGPERLAPRNLARHVAERPPFLWHTGPCVSHFDPDNPYSSSDAADYGADDIKQHFVELAETGSASEASALAAKLRRAGIIALANAQQYPRQRGARGTLRQHMRTFVMVFAADLDRAIEVLNDELGEEGEVLSGDIALAMQEAQDNPDAAMAWYYQEKEKKQRLRPNWLLLVLLGLIAAAVWHTVS